MPQVRIKIFFFGSEINCFELYLAQHLIYLVVFVVLVYCTVGFGKIKGEAKKPAASKKPFVAIGPQAAEDKPLNDPTNPEYDDQGYTLYADEKTGKKTRVFEALVDYPCDFTMKIVGANESKFVEEIVAVVAESCETDPGRIPHSFRSVGKWTSVTVKVG
jgi:putative lipoic acid-binding regulatory protein